MGEEITGKEVETQIMLLETPFGDGPHTREREQAAAWLLANAERSYPQLLARVVEGRASAAILDLIPNFQRTESIEPLARLMEGAAAAWEAGQAVARHPQPEASVALRRALENSRPDVVVIAADALATRGDPANCDALEKRLTARDARVRYHSLQASGKLGCLKTEILKRMSQLDEDPDVRNLAGKLLRSGAR